MRVELKCFAKLVSQDRCDYKASTSYVLEAGQTVGDLVDRAGVAREDVKIAFVNSRIASFDAVLSDGDRIGLAPAVGGM